jgi:hypothetical protein
MTASIGGFFSFDLGQRRVSRSAARAGRTRADAQELAELRRRVELALLVV